MSVLKLRCFSFLPPSPPSISLHSFFLCPLSLCLCPPYSFLCLISFLGFDFPFCFQLGEEGIPTEELEADLGEHLAADAANWQSAVVIYRFTNVEKTGCQQKQTMIHISEGKAEFHIFICLGGYTNYLFYRGPVNVHKSLFVCLYCP